MSQDLKKPDLTLPLCEKHNRELKKYPFPYEWSSSFGLRCDECESEKRETERLYRAGIPSRYHGTDLQLYKRDRKPFEGFRYKPFDLILTGGVGTGKTFLAIALLKERLKVVSNCNYVIFSGLIREVKESWRRDSMKTESQIIDNYSFNLDLLVIDEIGVQFGSLMETQYLTEIVNNRYNEFLPTILVGNTTHEDLKTFLGDRILDRIREKGKVVSFSGESYR